MNYVVLIPALNPTRELIDYVVRLQENNFNNIVLVDDGSSKEYQEIFDELKIMGCEVLHHAVNLGKGRAMKTGFNYYLNQVEKKNYQGLISVDSDGQHSIADVVKVSKQMEKTPDSLVLGSRNFSLDVVPPKSKFGNKTTCIVLNVLYGLTLQDTQTGLRGFPNEIVPYFIELYGERFEYETNMLIECSRQQIPIEEVEIETIYIDDNSETHFRPIKDSIAIYGLIFRLFFKYLFASIASFVLDVSLFALFVKSLKHISFVGEYIILATIFARICSSLFNYFVNKEFVFETKHAKNTLVKYYSLAVVQMILSGILVSVNYNIFHGNETVIKIIVDTCLFLISFQIQQRWVFKDNEQGLAIKSE